MQRQRPGRGQFCLYLPLPLPLLHQMWQVGVTAIYMDLADQPAAWVVICVPPARTKKDNLKTESGNLSVCTMASMSDHLSVTELRGAGATSIAAHTYSCCMIRYIKYLLVVIKEKTREVPFPLHTLTLAHVLLAEFVGCIALHEGGERLGSFALLHWRVHLSLLTPGTKSCIMRVCQSIAGHPCDAHPAFRHWPHFQHGWCR